MSRADAFDHGEVGSRDLDADRRLDAGGEHVDAIADRLHPDVRHAGNLQRGIHLFDEPSVVSPARHCDSRLQQQRRLHHLERRRIGGGFGAPDFAEHAFTSGTSS